MGRDRRERLNGHMGLFDDDNIPLFGCCMSHSEIINGAFALVKVVLK